MRFILIEASAEFVHMSTENILIYVQEKKIGGKILKIVLIFRHLTFVWELSS